MRIAVLSNIRSCNIGLEACLDKISTLNIDLIVVLGGHFGFLDPTTTVNSLKNKSIMLFSDAEKQHVGLLPTLSKSIYMPFRTKEKRKYKKLVEDGLKYKIIDGILFSSSNLSYNDDSIEIFPDSIVDRLDIPKCIVFPPSGNRQCIIANNKMIESPSTSTIDYEEELIEVHSGQVFNLSKLGHSQFCVIDNTEIKFESVDYDLAIFKNDIEKCKLLTKEEKSGLMKRFFPDQQ